MRTKTLLLATALSGCAIEPETSEQTLAITNTDPTSDHPSVVRIQIDDGIGDAVGCTASVLSRHWLLTAAHCLVNQAQGSRVIVLGGQDARRVSSAIQHFDGPGHFYIHPDWADWYTDGEDDIALIRLEGAGMASITEQMGIYTGTLTEASDVIVVGYGLGTDAGTSEWCEDGSSGIKRAQDYNLNSAGGELLQFDWGDAKVCPGDSGGPWLFPHAEHTFAAGVTSHQSLLENDIKGSRTSAKRQWIQDTVATSTTPAKCRFFVQMGEQGISYYACFESQQGVRPPAVSAGRSHACAVLYDGRARCWGDNQFGQLGDGTFTDRDMPVSALWSSGGGSTTLDNIAAGWSHTCAVSADDRVSCWGSNASGQLGNPTLGTGNFNEGQPVQFASGTALTGVRSIAAGGSHSCALTWAGRVYCWGQNSRGQLGNDTTTASTQPTLVGQFEELVSDPGFRTAIAFPQRFLPLEGVIAIEAGYRHTCAIKSNYTMVCWGDNTFGQLGNGTTTQSSQPVNVASLTNVFRISAGYYHTCATYGSAGDRAACWGYNGTGQLGTGNTTSSSTPRTISVGLGVALEVSAGMLHTCFVGSSKTQKCTGYNTSGELGNNSTATSYTLVPSLIEADARVPMAGNEFTCTLLHSGTVACSGRNADGQLGANNVTNHRWFNNVHHLHHLPGAP